MIRVIPVLLAFVALTLVLLPFQLIGRAFSPRLQRTVPQLYHCILCRLFGVRISEIGRHRILVPHTVGCDMEGSQALKDRLARLDSAHRSLRESSAVPQPVDLVDRRLVDISGA